MKKGLLILVPALLLALTACDLSGIIEKLGGDDNEDDGTSQNVNGNSKGNGDNGAGYDDSIFDQTESVDKLMAYGKETGFEIVTNASTSDSEGSETTLAMKGNIWWTLDEDGSGTGYRLENGVCSMLTYDNSNQSWSVLINNVGETQFVEMFSSVSSYLYSANEYFANEGFTANGSGKYAGRDILKFKYHRAVATVSINHEYYVEKDLGITIYNYADTTTSDGTSWAKLETTSFKTGSQVVAPVVA